MRLAEQKAREDREAELVTNRLAELYENPIRGDFDIEHLKSVHAYLFQDLPEHRPGVIRERTEDAWVKHRALEGQAVVYDVHYANQDIEAKLADALRGFGGPQAIEGMPPDAAAASLAKLYGDLDHAHGFYEGNSRTLREFTRELAAEAGYALDWIKTDIGAPERNQLYMARDLEVLERAFPDLTPERAMQTNDRAEYEASFVMTGLRQAVGEKTLDAIIHDGLSPAMERERAETYTPDRTVSMSDTGIKVFDGLSNVIGDLCNVVSNIISLGAMLPRSEPAWVRSEAEEQRVGQAFSNMRESLERGEGVSIHDLRNLTRDHLVNIASGGDEYLKMMVYNTERDHEIDLTPRRD